MSESRVDAIIECVNNVDQLRDTGELMALLVV
jgi:hypothetical protein